MFCCWTLYYRGELGELSRVVPAVAEASTRNGNRYTAVTLRCAFPMAWMARMEPDEIEHELLDHLQSWTTPGAGYQMQHLFALCSRVDLALYRGRPEEVTKLIAAERPAMRRAMIDRPPIHALLLNATFGRHALACAAAAPEGSARRKEALAVARKIAKRCDKVPMPLTAFLGRILRGAVAELEGHPAAAIAEYQAGLANADPADSGLYYAAVQYRLGGLLGDDALRASVIERFTAEGVRDPDTMLAMLLPGPR